MTANDSTRWAPEMPLFMPVPDDVALMDQALAAARDDMRKLVDHLRCRTATRSRDVATSELVQGLLDSPDWDRLELASTLGAAIAQIITTTNTPSRDGRQEATP